MGPSRTDRPSTSRRAFLAGAAALPIGVGAAAASAQPSDPTPGADAESTTPGPTVATWNVYLGVDLFRLFRARSIEDVRRIAGELLDEIERHPYEARAEAIAAEIDAVDADVVALQEAALIRTRAATESEPTDTGAETDTASAGSELVDLLSLVESALAERGLPYDVAATAVSTDVEFPADSDDGEVTVHLTDRDALLVRSGVEASDVRSETYDASVSLSLPDTDRELTLRRGYCAADVAVADGSFRAAATHLESVSADARRRQAEELIDALSGDPPVVVCGDFNSGPGERTDAYDVLTGTYDDAYDERRPAADGFTCCQAADLRNDRSHLDSRVDGLLYRGDLRPASVERVGAEPDDRATATVDGEAVAVWPSDHAGVVATFDLSPETPTPSATPAPTATPTATVTPTATRTETETRTPARTDGQTRTASGSGPGLGAASAVAGVAFGVLARLRRE